MLQKSNQKGFTLLELIIVVSVISILSLTGIYSFSFVQVNARNAKRKADLQEMAKALESYKARFGEYPITTPGPGNSGYKWFAHCAFSASSSVVELKPDDQMIPGLAPEFIPKIPHDPREGNANPSRSQGCSGSGCGNCSDADRNCYKYMSNGVDYKIVAHCSPEGNLETDDSYFDPKRYQSGSEVKWAWQVSSSSRTANW